MFKKLHGLTAPISFAAASFVMILAMLIPGSYASPPLSADFAGGATAVIVPETPAPAAEETEAVEETEKREPARPETVCGYNDRSPMSIANTIVDMTPRMEQKRMEEESAALANVSFSPPKQDHIIYYLTDEEYVMLCWCVEGEGRGKSLMHREIITQVIFNRVFNPRFPDTVKAVVTSPRQFNAMDVYNPKYFDTFVTPLTLEAVDNVINDRVGDLSQGALYFCNPNTAVSVDWFENRLRRLFDLENHRFYTYP